MDTIRVTLAFYYLLRCILKLYVQVSDFTDKKKRVNFIFKHLENLHEGVRGKFFDNIRIFQ